jgi:hypothetical protein
MLMYDGARLAPHLLSILFLLVAARPKFKPWLKHRILLDKLVLINALFEFVY